MTVLLTGAWGLFGWQILRRWRLMTLGPNENRFDQIGAADPARRRTISVFGDRLPGGGGDQRSNSGDVESHRVVAARAAGIRHGGIKLDSDRRASQSTSAAHDFVDAGALPSDPREVYVELAVRDLETKVIADFGSDDVRQYDLQTDPLELHPTPVLGTETSTLAQALQSEKRSAVVAPHEPEDFARMTQQLRNLGYL